MTLDQQDYYYDENPVITLKNMNFPEKVTVTYLGYYPDKNIQMEWSTVMIRRMERLLCFTADLKETAEAYLQLRG